MVLSATVQSSIWAYGSHNYPKYLGVTTGIGQPNMGCWSSPTLAPNGKVYCLPVATTLADASTLQKIAVITPGIPNTDTTNYTASTISFIDADGSSGKPLIPTTGSGTTWRRYGQRGILAPNGLLYFIPENETSILVLDPVSETWDLKSYTAIETDTGITAGLISSFSFKSAVLGYDGYIYLIPNKSVTIRIAPRNTAVNPSSVDIYQKGYYDGSTAAKNFKGTTTASMYPYPKSSTGVQLTSVANIRLSSAPAGLQYVGDIAMGLQHPNGKIYMGGGMTRWIFMLDPSNWGLSNEIYSDVNLDMSSYLLSGGGNNLKAFSKDLFLPKLKTGQLVNTLKIQYITDTYLTTATITYDPLLQSLEIDPVTNTVSPITSCFPLNTSGNGGTNLGNTGGLISNTIQLPSGLFLKTRSTAGTMSRFVLTGDSEGVLSNYQNYGVSGVSVLAGLNNAAFQYAMGGYSRIGASVIPPNEKATLTLVVGGEGASASDRSGEVVSIKQYSPGTTYFSYSDDDKALYEIPTNLADLPTSLYNSYCNKTK
jgi:hypothetical protein